MLQRKPIELGHKVRAIHNGKLIEGIATSRDQFCFVTICGVHVDGAPWVVSVYDMDVFAFDDREPILEKLREMRDAVNVEIYLIETEATK